MEQSPEPLLRLLEQSLEVIYKASGSFQAGIWLGWSSRPHTVVIQIAGGQLYFEIQGSDPMVILDGGGYILPEGMRFRCQGPPDSPLRIHWGHFQFRVLGELDLFHFIQTPFTVGIEIGRQITAINQQLRATLEESNGHLIARVAQQRRLCGEMLDLIVSTSRPRPGAIETITSLTRLNPVLRFMREQMARPIFGEELAAIAGLSLSRFHALFQETTKQSPLQYLTRLRLRHAQELLLSTQRPINEIAQAVGYRDAFHFSQVFKRSHGVSPSHYRKGGGASYVVSP